MVKFSRKYRNKNLRHKSKKQIGGSLKNALFRVIDKIHYDYSLNPKWAKDHLLKALISPPVNINARNSNGYTPLSLAIRYLDENLTKILLEHNANPNVYYIELENFENHNITLLHRISNDERHISTTNVEDSSDDEESLESLEKQKTIMRLLLKHGANVNSITSTYFDTPLHMAVKKNNHELIKILLDKGANTELKNNNNHSPLDVAKIKVNNNSPHSVEGIKSRKTVKLLEAHEAKRRRSDLYTQYVGRSSNPRLNTDTINKIKPFYGGNDAQDVQGASLEIFDKIISDYKNKTGMRGAEYEGQMQRLLATDGSRGVHRPRLEQLAHEQAIVQNAAQGRGRPLNAAEAEAIAAQVVAARHRPAQRRPQLQDVAELASRAGQAAQARARRAWSRGRLVSHMTEVRFALRIMNMLRQEFMKCHYSPNPGQGYLDAKENFESLTFKGQAGGQKFRPKKLKYKPYYGGNDAQDAQDAQAAANLALKADADNAIKEARTAALFKAVITSETPFENYNEQLAKELLDTGIDPNSRNENQVTLLGFAVDRLKTNMVKILLEYNADPNLNCTPGPNDSGPSLPPLHMLTMNLTHLEPYDPNNNAVHALFENEAHWTQMVKNQNIQAQKDILVLLLKNGANINKLNSDNDAPIHLAIETENKHLLQKLLDNGANPDILNFNGKSPLILASDSLHESDLAVATLLVENNPIPPSLMERGANALDMVNILRIHLAKRERNKVLTTQLAPPTNKDIIPTNELPKGKRIITKSNDYPLISDVIGNINSYYGGNSKKTKNPYYYRKSKKNKKLVTKKQKGGVIYVDDENDKMRFECPISTEIMNEPVIAEDGYSYEKEEIVNWIKLSEDKGNPITSPITGDNMGKTLIPNTVLKDIIENSVFDRQHTNQESSQIQDENKNKGIVIQYKNSKYGFIHTFDGIDNLFFHSSQLDNQIIVGDIVSFVIKEFKGKPTATNIKLIEPAWNRKTGVIVKYNNDKQYGFIEPNINGMPHIFVHVSEINQRVSVGDKVSFIIGKNMAGKAVAKKVKIINDKIDDEIGVEEEKKEDSEIPQLKQRLMELIFERERIMREREKVNSEIKSRK